MVDQLLFRLHFGDQLAELLAAVQVIVKSDKRNAGILLGGKVPGQHIIVGAGTVRIGDRFCQHIVFPKVALNFDKVGDQLVAAVDAVVNKIRAEDHTGEVHIVVTHDRHIMLALEQIGFGNSVHAFPFVRVPRRGRLAFQPSVLTHDNAIQISDHKVVSIVAVEVIGPVYLEPGRFAEPSGAVVLQVAALTHTLVVLGFR